MSVKRMFQFKRRSALLLLLAGLFVAVSAVYFIRFLAKPNTGLVVNYPEVINEEGKIIFSPKTPFSPAVASGLKPSRDQIVAIDGRPVHSIRDVVEADARIWHFHRVPVEVVRDGWRKLIVEITPAFTLTRLDWVFALIVCIALGFTAFYLFIHLPEDTASNLIALAALFYLVFTALKPFYYESFFSNLLIHFGKLTSWFMVFFAIYFPATGGRRVFRRAIIAVVLAVYSVFIVLRMIYFSSWASTGQDLWLERYRVLGKLNNAADGVAFAIYLVLLVRAYIRTPHILEKRQLEWIVGGFLIAIPPYFFLDQLPLILGGPQGLRISMGNFANLFLAFVPLFFIIGLLKHRVFNIKFFISRYIVYILLALIIFSFFTVLYEPSRNLFVLNYGLPERLASFLVTTVLFILLIPIRTLICNVVDRLFYSKYYRRRLQYSASLEKRNMELRLLIDELNRQNMRSFQKDKMRELRGIITGIAHRVNDPVNFISGSLSVLDRRLQRLFKTLESRETPSADEIGKLKKESRRLIDVAQEGDLGIRDFVRKLATLVGSRSSIPVSVAVDHLLRNARVELLKSNPAALLKFEELTDVKILCNPDELIQVLHYLVQNSLESGIGPKDEILIRCDLYNGYVRLQVTDEGAGIDEGNLKKIFDPFFSTKAGHDGLGLYFGRMLVERSSGSIQVSSKPGRGTSVTVLFPLGEPEPQG